MNKSWLRVPLARRGFLGRLGGVAGVLGAAAVSAPRVLAETTPGGGWQPARHTQDDWLDEIPGLHRFVFDTTTPEGFALGFQFASNYYDANRDSYGVEAHDLAMVMVARHKSTTFGYSDAVWAKYGKQFSAQSGYIDPKTQEPPTANPYTARMKELAERGVRFAVCQMASGRIAAGIAKANGGDANAIMKEFAANLLPNARLVPAGIVAVNRAQERGYSLVTVA